MTLRTTLSLLFALGWLTTTDIGAAQGDVERPLPNVLLLVDTSGSMEFKAEDNAFPTCHPGNPSAANEKSRWIDLVEVMTGSFENYSCFAMDRSSSGFLSEYSLSTTRPYDYNYVNPFHRIISGGCVVGPGVLPTSSNPYAFHPRSVNTFSFVAPADVVRPTDLAAHTGCSEFRQAADGMLDVFKEKVRFGLMTFDTHVDDGTGLSSGHLDFQSGTEGTWSYYLSSGQMGRPARCATDQMQEVGARNAAAPVWEGRMVAFGPPDATGAQILERNEYIQNVLLSTRPYGATPIAGLLHDAREFLWHDTAKDPLDESLTPKDFGPRNDPMTKVAECRRNLIILLSDGEPNLDLRPHCENTAEGGKCPYQRPEEIAWDLLHNPANDPDQFAEIAVIGFALSRVTPAGSPEIGCEELTDEQCAQNPNDRAIQACCTLNKIAAAGGRPNADGSAKRAYFPQDRVELRRTFSTILSDVTNHLTTRTAAAFSNAGSQGGNFQFSSSFTPLLEEPWRGNLTRTRIECEDGEPVERAVDENEGDDFAANLNSGIGERKFYTFVPEGSARNSMRPRMTSASDGIQNGSGTLKAGLSNTQLLSEVPSTTMEVDANDCEGTSPEACRDAILGWTLGLTNAEGETRCLSPGTSNCNLLGAIYHSTPKIVPGVPGEFLRDESYDAFVALQRGRARPSVLYTASIDGQLHAFKTAPQDPESAPESDRVRSKRNNELWAFLPPAVLPVLQAQYPNTPATLLDGIPVVKDVPSTPDGSRFERSAVDAQSGTGDWRTVLVMGFGNGQIDGGYFALDVTNPTAAQGGPKFLWQLTRDGNGQRLFGNGGTPLIATVFLKNSSTDLGKEVAVAILPGGDQGLRTGDVTSAGPTLAAEDERFAASNEVNAYENAEQARSLTVVRLDTGEILRTFRPSLPSSEIAASVVSVVDIPAPVLGQPAAFPSAAGSVADRVFVGDREGRIWRLDVSKATPSEWTLDVFFDAYFDQDVAKRQPIELAPVVSVDATGRITVAAATGEQQVQSAGNRMLNRVVSLTETLSESFDFEAQVNWIQDLGCAEDCQPDQKEGERVTGPLSLFGSALYFATSSPGQVLGGQCGSGTSRIWGTHYIQSRDEAAGVASDQIDPMNGPAGALPTNEDVTELPKATDPEPGLVFGVSVEQQPTCSSEFPDFTDDPYLGGYGQHTAQAAINPGSFSLVYQIGGVGGGSSNRVTTTKLPLTTPRSTVFIDSWTPIFE